MADIAAALAAFPSWYVVLPDCAAAEPVGVRLGEYARRRIPHSSGRPFLLGDWAARPGAEAVTVGRSGTTTLVAAGQHALGTDGLDRAAARTATPAEARDAAGAVPGSFHLFASLAGQVYAQGTVSGLRRIYTARLDGLTLAADRADVLALLAAPHGAPELDERQLAFHLLDPPLLHPLTDRPVWRGVRELPPDQGLLLDPGGRERAVRRWSPPEPALPLDEGAPGLGRALAAAVAARTAGRSCVSADLSGLDSTSVCCLAAHGGPARPRVIAFTAAGTDPLDDDVYWAERTAAAVDGIEHHIVPAGEMPLIYQELPGMTEPFDEPCGVIADHARWLALVRRGAAHGSALHLTGFGGDELLGAGLSHLRTLLRRRPLTALRRARDYAALYRWPRRQVLRQLCETRSYRAWFGSAAGQLTAPPPPDDTPSLGRGPTPRMPPWATDDAVRAVRELIRETAPTAAPLYARRGLHDDIEGLREAARPLRLIGQLSARAGVALAAPFYDDRVLDAALAVRPEEKRTPWRYKPLLTEAVRGAVPAACLERESKPAGTCDLDTALRANRAELLALWEDSRLARLGLADAAALRALCAAPLQRPAHDLHGGLYQAVACELWLRSQEHTPVPARRHNDMTR